MGKGRSRILEDHAVLHGLGEPRKGIGRAGHTVGENAEIVCLSPISTSRRMARHSKLSSLSLTARSCGSRELLILIFELALSLGELLGHLICAARGITIEGSRLQKYGLTELEFWQVPSRGWLEMRVA